MFKLKSNMATMDRVARTMAGSTLLAVGPLTNLGPTDTMSNIILSSMATVALLSAAFSYCVLYEVTGFDTCGKK